LTGLRGIHLLFYIVLFTAALAAAGERSPVVDVFDQPVCKVNTETISKRQVEQEMGDVAALLYMRRREWEAAGVWNAEFERKWFEQYGPAFSDAMRRLIRERLMLQQAITDKVPVDEKDLEKRVEEKMTELRGRGEAGPSGYTAIEVRKLLRENMLLNHFRTRFYSPIDNPQRQDVQRFYQENIGRYQRKAGVKVRLIRINRFATDKFTGKPVVRADARDVAEKLRQDVADYGASFAEVAKASSDDAESRPRGGLLMLSARDPFFSPRDYNKPLAAALRGLKAGEVTKVFELDESSWAIALLEDEREAGPAPLEGAVYEDIYKQLLDQKTRKQEDEWLHKTLAKAYVVQIREGKEEPLPMTFFFPDEVPAGTPGR
jgi:parvulin-like peptidyl-prolyl isomerase